MISISEAQDIIKKQSLQLNSCVLPLADALAFHLSQEVFAPIDLPTFDNSAMDGYAVCGYDETYQVIGEVAAGDVAAFSLKEGQAVRIFTGGKVPENATAVIMQEKVEVKSKLLNVKDDVLKGKNIRRKGEEIGKGTKVFDAGQKITPATVATLSSLGFTEVSVYNKPKVRIITTGNELITPGQALEEGQIYESNGVTLSAALAQTGFLCEDRVSVKDDFDSIKWSIGEHLNACNVLLVSGGISVGEYDYVKKALEENGVSEVFYKVAQKPGKPLYFGRRGDTFVFALPGNPASALTCFYIHVLPLLQRISGGVGNGLTKVELPLAEEYIMKSDRPTFFKANVADGQVDLMQGQSSAMLYAMALGNAICYLDEKKVYEKGAMVTTYLLPS